MRVAAVADLHGHLPPVPRCDLLVIGGDLCPSGSAAASDQARWLDGPFRRWLATAPADSVVGVAGNHDHVFERAPHLTPPGLRWEYLQDSGTRAQGLSIWGSPWTPWFHDMAFNAPRSSGEPFLRARYERVPPETDLLLIHGPPFGYGDVTPTGQQVGSTAALDVIDRVQPRVCIFGHVHEGRGSWLRTRTRLANVAALDSQGRLRSTPFVVFDL